MDANGLMRAKRMHVKVLALTSLQIDSTPASRLQHLQQLAAEASPPEDQPVGPPRTYTATVCLHGASHVCPDTTTCSRLHACAGLLCACAAANTAMPLHVAGNLECPPVIPCDNSSCWSLLSQVDMLDGKGAGALAAAMREVDPEKLGAAAAVPLVIMLMQYELVTRDQVGVRRQAVMFLRGGSRFLQAPASQWGRLGFGSC